MPGVQQCHAGTSAAPVHPVFFKSFHEALHGRRPGLISRFKVTPDFRPLIRTIDEIARARSRDRKRYMELLKTGSFRMFTCLNRIIARRITSRAGHWEHLDRIRNKNLADLIQQFEIPSHVRALFEEDPEPTLDHGSRINLSDVF